MTHIIKNNQIRQVPSFRKNMLDNIDKFLARLNFSCPILNRLVKNRYTEVSTQSLTLCTARSGLSCLFWGIIGNLVSFVLKLIQILSSIYNS